MSLFSNWEVPYPFLTDVDDGSPYFLISLIT